MHYIADLHIHSKYSRATSSRLDLEHLWLWAQIKGISVVATGDCIHPGWLDEIEQKLTPAGDGFYMLRDEYCRALNSQLPAACAAPVRFILSTEISSIYKRDGAVRKVHNVVCLPDTAAARRLQARLEGIGNIRSDGRPILGLDARELLAMTLQTHADAFLIPAHIWTPWFSVLGSKSGFDSIEECFGDLSSHIFALETGLSSDPPMNWRLSRLDPYVLVSNSDAHSPHKLGREANIFDTELSYEALLRGLRDPQDRGFCGTIEFFPEEGKYHFDGHRKCQTRMHPRETIAHNGLCTVCGKPVTVGVMARVEELADHPEGRKGRRSRPFVSMIPLQEIVADALGVGPVSRRVAELCQALASRIGPEFFILRDAEIAQIDEVGGPLVGEAIRRVRNGQVELAAGYDGEFGTIRIFTDQERRSLAGMQTSLFKPSRTRSRTPNTAGAGECAAREEGRQPAKKKTLHSAPAAPALNAGQQAAVDHESGHLLIVAGPGTGKTHTLTHRIARLASRCESGRAVLAVTFTNKAAIELAQRLFGRLALRPDSVMAATFHQFCIHLLRHYALQAGLRDGFSIATDQDRLAVGRQIWPDLKAGERRNLLEEISRWKSCGAPASSMPPSAGDHDAALRRRCLLDFDDLLLRAVALLRSDATVRSEINSRFVHVCVDEYQDINAVQFELLRLLVTGTVRLCAIGDPNQAIYGFRGSDKAWFDSFPEDFAPATVLRLQDNYRSAHTILQASGSLVSGAGGTVPPLVARLHLQGALIVHECPTERAEAEYVVHQIERLIGGTSHFSRDSGRVGDEGGNDFSFGDCAVLYRLNNQRHALEEAFERSGMPYAVGGDQPWTAHPFVNDTLTLLQLACGAGAPAVSVGWALQRFVHGLGDTAREAIVELVQQRCAQRDTGAGSDARVLLEDIQAISRNSRLVEELQEGLAVLAAMLRDLAHGAGSMEALQIMQVWPGFDYAVARDAECIELWRRLQRQCSLHESLYALVDALCLQRSDDSLEERAEKVSLMTLHASKGLEFGAVFIVGCEQDLIPLQMDGRTGDPDEERRLLYVGMTRARSRLYLVHSQRRTIFGSSNQRNPSPFLADIEEQLKTYEAAQARKKRVAENMNCEQLSLFEG